MRLKVQAGTLWVIFLGHGDGEPAEESFSSVASTGPVDGLTPRKVKRNPGDTAKREWDDWGALAWSNCVASPCQPPTDNNLCDMLCLIFPITTRSTWVKLYLHFFHYRLLILIVGQTIIEHNNTLSLVEGTPFSCPMPSGKHPPSPQLSRRQSFGMTHGPSLLYPFKSSKERSQSSARSDAHRSIFLNSVVTISIWLLSLSFSSAPPKIIMHSPLGSPTQWNLSR